MMRTVLKHSKFRPAQGGHAPGDVRRAFSAAVDAYAGMTGDDKQEPSVELREQQIPIGRVCGLLWNCSDTMPGWLRYEFGSIVDTLHEPITYAKPLGR
jgi:hypothetical protein